MKQFLLTAAALICSGCDALPSGTSNVAAKPKKPVIETSAEPQAPQFAPQVGDAVAPASPPPPVERVREAARPGVLDKEKYEPAFLTIPLATYLSTEQQVVFDFQIPKAMQIFEGLQNRKPNSHREFMSEIIGKNGIRLPSLPLEHRYVYDPELGQLMVEKPKTGN